MSDTCFKTVTHETFSLQIFLDFLVTPNEYPVSLLCFQLTKTFVAFLFYSAGSST